MLKNIDLFNNHFMTLPATIDKDKSTKQYKFFKALTEPIDNTLSLGKDLIKVKHRVFPFIEQDIVIKLTDTAIVQAEDVDYEYTISDISTYEYADLQFQEDFYPTKLVSKTLDTDHKVKKMQPSQYILNEIYSDFKDYQNYKNLTFEDKKITSPISGDTFELETTEDIISVKFFGGIIYYITATKFVQYDYFNDAALFTIQHDFSNAKNFIIVPNGLIVLKSDDTYDQLEFGYDYIIKLTDENSDIKYCVLDQFYTNADLDTIHKPYTYNDNQNEIYGFSRAATTTNNQFYFNYIYNKITKMELTEINVLSNTALKTKITSYTNLNFSNKLLVVKDLIENHGNY